MFCSNCGSEYNGESHFCLKCGNQLSSQPSQQQMVRQSYVMPQYQNPPPYLQQQQYSSIGTKGKKKNITLILTLVGFIIVVAVICVILIKPNSSSSSMITEDRIRIDLLENRVFDSISWTKEPNSYKRIDITKSRTENNRAVFWITVQFEWGDVGFMSYRYIDYKVTYEKYNEGWLFEKAERESELYE